MGFPSGPQAMNYQLLQRSGSLQQAGQTFPDLGPVLPEVLELVPEAVAREQLVLPLKREGETLTLAAVNPRDLPLLDKLTFILNKKIRLVEAPRAALVEAINFYYGQTETESVDSMLQELTDTQLTVEHPSWASASAPSPPLRSMGRYMGKSIVEFRKGMKGLENTVARAKGGFPFPGLDHTSPLGDTGMFFYTVEEGQRVLMRRPDGTMEVIVGPRRVWRGFRVFQPMQHFLAHPGEFLIIRYRDGRQEHLPGPAEIWFDPRIHQEITRQEALQLGSKEAVVVYFRQGQQIQRRIEYGPAQFVPQPGEWLHTFAWHASKGGHLGVEKVPRGLVFQKLWLMPDQMYHDVADVRTADDAVLTVRLMIFFELVDIGRMLDTTHDPIGDFVNAATSDVVDFTGRHDFESFKRNVPQLNELETYRQLINRAQQSGYRINKVVYRGYGAPKPLQDMHDKAIEARTKLQLDRATEQQAQDLENYKLEAQIARSSKRRTEQTTELEHDLDMTRLRQELDLQQKQAQRAMLREQRRLEADLSQALRQQQDTQQREHLTALRDLGVDLTAYLTQARADRVIEFRGATGGTHVHLDQLGQEKLKRNGEG
jgi:hypothetical protein